MIMSKGCYCRFLIIFTTIIRQLFLLNAALTMFDGESNLHQVVVTSLASIPQHSFNLYQPAFPWNETYPYHLLRAGLPSHEFRLHPKVMRTDSKFSEPFYLAFTDFRDHSFGNHLGIYFEILSCAIETDTPIEVLFPFHFEPLRSDSNANIISFLRFLPSSFARADDVSVLTPANVSTADDAGQRGRRRLSPASEAALAEAQKKINTVCVCGEYCWGNPRSLWIRQLPLLRNITRGALDKFLRSQLEAGALRALNNDSLLYEFAGRWQPLVPDVSIQFRCSDVLGSTNGAYGYLNFNVYKKLIPVDTRLLYILSDHPDRAKERNQSPVCGQLIDNLAATLRAFLPQAEVVAIRGGDLVLSFAQLTLSRITICSSSTFCLWPALASEGTAYFPHSTLLLNGETGPVRQAAPPSFKLVMAPRIMTFKGYTENLPRILGLLHQPIDNVDVL